MKDKVVIITGGSAGIGKGLAFEFGRKGSKLVITGRDAGALQKTGEELSRENIDHLLVQADVSKQEDNDRMVKLAIEKYQKIDVLINNAGISMRASVNDIPVDVIRKVMEINFFGTVMATKSCLPHIRATKGSVVGISSIAGFRALPERAGYSSSKFAMHGFLEVLRTELLHSGVHVLIACPGFTKTDIRAKALTNSGQELGSSPRDESKMMSVEEVSRLIYKATVNRKKYLVMTTQGKLIVWINKLFPALADRLVYNNFKKEKNSSLTT